MAKDGTNRGGARVGAGRKPKSMHTKENEGAKVEKMLKPVGLFPMENAPELSDLPVLKNFLTEEQQRAVPLESQEIYGELYSWLKSVGCETLIPQTLIDLYVMSVARWRQCEKALSAGGFLSAHPTTGATIASPFVQMSQTYTKQINSLWCQIYQIVKENSTGDARQAVDPMEELLSGA